MRIRSSCVSTDMLGANRNRNRLRWLPSSTPKTAPRAMAKPHVHAHPRSPTRYAKTDSSNASATGTTKRVGRERMMASANVTAALPAKQSQTAFPVDGASSTDPYLTSTTRNATENALSRTRAAVLSHGNPGLLAGVPPVIVIVPALVTVSLAPGLAGPVHAQAHYVADCH
jgi:hypothetical protein